MRKETSCLKLLGTASALALGLGISPAYCAPAVLGFHAPAVTDRVSPVLDLKADVNAGLGGVDADVSVGAKDSESGDVGVDVGAGVGGNAGANADVDAHVGGGATGGAGIDADVDDDVGGGATGGAGADADVGADVGGGATGGAGVDAGVGADVGGGATGGAGVDADVGADVGTDTSAGAAASGGVSAGGGSSGAAASGNVNAGAAAIGGGASASMPGSPSTSPSPGALDVQAIPEISRLSASDTVDVPPALSLLPLLPSGAHRAEDAVIAANQRQRPPVECASRTVNGDCPGTSEPEIGVLPKPRPLQPEVVPSGSSDASKRATELSAPTARTAALEPAALTSGGLGISLVEPVRKDKGLLVQGIIVNTSDQTQAVPPLHISLLNSAGHLVQYSVTKAPVDTLAQRESWTFKIMVRPLPPTVARITVSLIPRTP